MIHGHGLHAAGIIAGGAHEGGLAGSGVDGVEVTVVVVDGVQNAIVVGSQGQTLSALALGLVTLKAGDNAQIGDFAAEVVQGDQVAALACCQLIGQDIEHIVLHIIGHIQSGIGKVTQPEATKGHTGPCTGLQSKDGAFGIDANKILAYEVGGIDIGLTCAHVDIGMLHHLVGCLEGEPAVEAIGGVEIVAAGDDSHTAEAEEVVIAIVLLTGEADLVEGLVSAVVADSQDKFRVEVADIDGHQSLLPGQILYRIVSHAIASGGHGDHSSDIIVVRDIELQAAAIGIGVIQIGDLIGIDHGGLGIDDDRHLDHIVHHLVAVIQAGLDGEGQLGAAGQVVALGIGEVIALLQIVGVNKGVVQTVGRQIVALAYPLGGLAVKLFAGLGIGIGEAQGLGATHHTEIDLFDGIPVVVTIGRQDVVGRIVSFFHIGVHAQIVGVIGAVVSPEDVDIAVDLTLFLGLIVPAAVVDTGSTPVAIEAHKGQAQINAILIQRVQADKAVYIDAVFIEGLHVGHVPLGELKLYIDGDGLTGLYNHHIALGQAGGDQLIQQLCIGGVDHAVIVKVHVKANAIGELRQANDEIQQCLDVVQIADLIAIDIIDGVHIAFLDIEGGNCTQTVSGLAHEEVAVSGVAGIHKVGHSAAGEGIGLGLLREVVDLEGEGEVAALGIVIAHGDLGGRAVYGQVAAGGHSVIDVGNAGALLTGRILDAVGVHNLVGVIHGRRSGGHDQCLSYGVHLGIGHFGMGLVEVLQHQSCHTCNMRSGHGGTGHDAVLAIVHGGVDVAAGGGDIGSQLQVGVHAPGGEVTHLACNGAGGGHVVVGAHDGHGADAIGRSSGHGFAIGLRDESVGQKTCVFHVDHIAFHIVIDNAGAGTGGVGIGLLLGEGDLATGNHGHLACHIDFCEVSGGAQAGNHDVLQLGACQSIEGGSGDIVVSDLLVAYYKIQGHGADILDAGDHSSAFPGGGRGDDAVIGISGQVGVGAVAVHQSSGGAVTCGDGGDHVVLGDLGEDLVPEGITGAGKACGRTHTHIHSIHIQPVAILQSGQDVAEHSAAGGLEYLHDDDLCIGGHTNHLGGVDGIGGGNTGNMGAMVAHLIMIVGHIQAVGAIVKAKGDLLTMVDLLSGQVHAVYGIVTGSGIGIADHTGDLLCGQRGLGGLGSIHKGGMIGIQAGVQNGNTHTGTGIACGLPGQGRAKGLRGGIHIGADTGAVGGHILRDSKNRRNKSSTDTVHSPDLRELAVGNLYAETADDDGVAVACSDFSTGEGGDIRQQGFLLQSQGILGSLNGRGIGSNLLLGVALIQQGVLFHNHDHGDQVLRIVAQSLGLNVGLAIQLQILSGVFDLFYGHSGVDGSFNLHIVDRILQLHGGSGEIGLCGDTGLGLSGESRRNQGQNHAQSQHESKNTIQFLHDFLPPA